MGIIGISGKKTVGKDVVGKIIQYLTSESYKKGRDYETFIRKQTSNLDFEPHYISKWQIKKFADKLKDIICLLIGCSRDQLENESFKSKELGEEWWYWYMERDGGYSPIILDYLTTTKKELKSYEGLKLIKPTSRFLLQFIGTNLFRNQLHPEIWVNSLMSEYKPYLKGTAHNLKNWAEVYNHKSCKCCGKSYMGWKRQYLCKECIEDDSIQFYPNWIITDMRFPNELEAVKKRGGITIRVNRPCDICGGSGYHKMSCPVSKSGEHYSEIALDSAAFDYIIENSGSIEELIEKVKEILIKERLL